MMTPLSNTIFVIVIHYSLILIPNVAYDYNILRPKRHRFLWPCLSLTEFLRAKSRVSRTMRMARRLETPAMLSKSVSPTARAISIPTSNVDRMDGI